MPDGIFLYNTGGIREWWLSACGVCCARHRGTGTTKGGREFGVVTSVTFN